MKRGSLLTTCWLTVVGLFLLFPILATVLVSFSEDQFVSGSGFTFSLRWYESYLHDRFFVDATLTSAKVAAVSTAIATTTGMLAAIAISRNAGRWMNRIRVVVLMPQIVPAIVVALSLAVFYAKLGLVGNIWILIFGHVLLILPIPILIILASLERYDVTLERAARVLGANALKAFVYVTLPFLRPALVVSGVLGFFVSFDDIPIALFLAGRLDTLPKRLWAELREELDPTIAAVATVLIVMTVLGVSVAEIARRGAARRTSN